MKILYSLFFAIITNVKGDDTFVEVEAFWERELQGSTTPPVTSSPTKIPTGAPIDVFVTDPPTPAPVVATGTPTVSPTNAPIVQETSTPTASPTNAPTISPTAVPTTSEPTASPVVGTPSPTLSSAPTSPCGLDPIDRRTQILTILEGASVPADLSTGGTPQNSAAEWIIGVDSFSVCPGDEKLIQRYVMALFYYSTDGDAWTLCSAGDTGCTAPNTPYLAGVHECEWFGSTCDADLCMTQIVFEANNVAGTVPFELEQLEGLEVISLEQGSISSTIPTTMGMLSNLRIFDLDFNDLSGTIPEEMYSLTSLEQLDLNSNKLTGTLSILVGDLTGLQLLQVYENLMTGTIPVELGNVASLVIGEFYNNTFTGTMPQGVCDNRTPNGNLNGLTSDCFPNPLPQIECACCTGCAVF